MTRRIPIILLLLAALVGCAGCATLAGAGGTVANAAIDCGRQALQAEVAAIAPDVQLILGGGAVDWQAQLDALKTRGLSALACAVAKVGVALAQGQAKPVMAAAVVTPSDRAAFYLLSRDLHPTNVQR